MVDKQIKQLLHHHDCVVIPEFGGLIARYVAARIHPVKHTFIPPSKKIAFNEKLILNDGLLISSIAHSRGISQQEAQLKVAAFVLQAKEKLKAENQFLLQDIGAFRYNAAQKLEFEFVETENLLDASFGLPEFISRPVQAEESAVLRTLIKERQPQADNTKQPLRRQLKRAYNVTAGLLIGGLTVTAFYLLSVQTDYNLSSLNPIFLLNKGGSMFDGNAYTRYTADYVPLTAEERTAAWQEALPIVAVQEQDTTTAWNSFASGSSNAEEVINLDDWNEGIPVTSDTEELGKEEVARVAAEPVVAQARPEVAAKQPATTAGTNSDAFAIRDLTGRSYIITGGYSTLKNAEYSREQIQKKGYSPTILLPGHGSRLYRVAVADFETEEEAHAVKREYRKTFGETIWVLKH